MTRLSLSSLRVRSLLFVLLAVFPVLGLTLSTGMAQRRVVAVHAEENALRLVRLVASHEEQLIEGSRQLLFGLAQLLPVRGGDSAACAALCADLLKRYPAYANLGVAKLHGDIVCSAVPLTQPVNYANRMWFQRAVQTRNFVVGEYQISRVVDRPVLPLGYPVLNAAGQVQAVVFTSLDLLWLRQLATEMQLPQDSVLTVIGRHGRVLARYPDPEKWVGQSVPEAPIVRLIQTRHREGTARAPDLDGIPRLFAFTPLDGGLQTGEVYLNLGIPVKVAFAEVNQLLIRNLTGLGLVTLLVLIAAWVGGDVFILRHVHVLLDGTKRVSAGDLSARTGLPYDQGELGQLACAFDEMAESLEQRVAERKRVEEEVRRLNAELEQRVIERTAELRRQTDLSEALLKAQSDLDEGVVITQDERIVYVNDALCRLYGYSAAELFALPSFLELIVPEERVVLAARLHQRVNGNNTSAYSETTILTKSRQRVSIDYAIQQIRIGDCTQSFAIMRDITERKQVEETLREANAELEAFAYSISHDLHAPLRAMDGFSRILLEDYAPHLAPEAAHYLQRVRDNAQQMSQLIDDLLAFSRLIRQPLMTQPVVPIDLVRQALVDLRDEQENRHVEISIGELPVCQADPALLKQVFVNLLANALKFTRRQAVARIEVGCQYTDGQYVYFVKDNGVGFDMQYVHKLFGVFQRLHRAEEYEGTGVGLAIVQRIVHRHGGRVWTEAAVDKGAAFYFTI